MGWGSQIRDEVSVGWGSQWGSQELGGGGTKIGLRSVWDGGRSGAPKRQYVSATPFCQAQPGIAVSN